MGRRVMSTAQLAVMLEDVAAHVEDPSAPHLAATVRARLETDAAPTRRRDRRSPRVRFAFAGVALAVALTMLLAFLPATRRAVAGWLGLRGVRIERITTPPATALGGDLALGDPVSLTEAQHRTDFDVLLPAESRFGPPDELYLAETPPGGRVDALYRSRSGLPPAAGSGVGMLLTEFRAHGPAETISKGVPGDAPIEIVTVDGREGAWLEGGPHTVTFLDENGDVFEDDTRLAGNTLLWERGPLTLRLESGLTKAEAIRVAESLVRP